MRRVDLASDLREEVEAARAEGRRVALVPTMGSFHAGHLSLIGRARDECDFVVVSVFVNPMQFDRRDDFQTYPRDEAADEQRAKEAGVDLLFVPSVDEMYPEGFKTRVEVEELSGLLCGATRQGHFPGVTTVVAKLLEMVRPDVAYFGEKDYQQLVIVRRMVVDLNMTPQIVGVPTVREEDGLAMSSRNQLLSAAEREAATVLYRSLSIARQMVARGETDPAAISTAMRRVIGEEPLIRLEYLSVVDPQTLREVRRIDRPVLIALAAFDGATRLIDNVVAEPV